MNTALLKNLWQRLLLLVLLCGVGHGTCAAETELSNVAPDSAGMFISDLCVSVATNSTEARNNLLDKGYTLLDYNLNHGVKGHYVYLGYKRSDNPLDAISKIILQARREYKDTTFTKMTYTMKAVPHIGLCNGNIKAGTDGPQLYLYYSRDKITGKNNSVITRLMHCGTFDTANLPINIRPVYTNVYDSGDNYDSTQALAFNLNGTIKGAKEKIYLICEIHEHTSDYYVTETDNGYYKGHDCCGVHYTDPLNGGVLEISNADELYEFADLVNIQGMCNLKAKLTADIVLNEGVTVMDNKDILTSQLNPDTTTVKAFRNWKPIGNWGYRFNGEFDGNGHTISGLYCKKNDEAGLFGFVGESASISNVTIKDSYIESEKGDCGGICGNITIRQRGTITINNCTFEGVIKVAKDYNAGGIFGQNTTVNKYSVINIENCATRGVIYFDSISCSAGIIGKWAPCDTNIKNCYSYIEIKNKQQSYKGGLVGNNSDGITTDHSYYLDIKKTTSQNQDVFEIFSQAQSKEDFKSGKVAFRLNEFQDKPQWSQIIYTDLYPVFFDGDKHTADAATVYMVEGYACTDKNISADTFLYSNRNDEPAILVHNGKRHHEAKQATCVEIGCLEYWECFDCSTLFSNAECTTIIINEPTLTATAQHDYDVYTETCVNCGKSRHQIEEEASAIEAVETDGIKSQMFDLLGRQVTESHRGITLIKGADGKVHKVLKK